nr:hypothetical protein [Desulfosarcina ovata]
MKDYSAAYKDKVISIEEAVQKIESDMEIVVGQVSVPDGLLDQLAVIANRVENVKVFFTITVKPYEFFMNPEMKGHFELCSYFHGPSTREALKHKSGNIFYQPNLLHAIAPDHLRGRGKPNIFWVRAALRMNGASYHWGSALSMKNRLSKTQTWSSWKSARTTRGYLAMPRSISMMWIFLSRTIICRPSFPTRRLPMRRIWPSAGTLPIS